MDRDSINMKELTEDAGHERQTSITVVKSKLEMLLQDVNLNEEQAGSVLQASNALSRLGKLNQGLLLLAKIENNQYRTNDEMSLPEITRKYLSLLSEFIKEKQLKIEVNIDDDCMVQIHVLLADSSITNVLGHEITYIHTEEN